MKAISQAIDKFCQKHRKFGISGLMKYIVFICGAVFIVFMMDTTGTFLPLLSFNPRLILGGQVWRIVTWIFLPVNSNPFWVVISLYFYYMVGSSLEREWGTAKFSVFYISGVIINIIFGFIVWLIFRPLFMIPPILPHFLNLSMFFAFAALFPESQIRLFFIIPIKIKWAALAIAAYHAFFIVSGLIGARHILSVLMALFPLVSILNFFLICGYDLLLYLRPVKARASRQTINFKKEAKKVQREYSDKPYRHKCAVCGKTDADNPGLEFRYCSRCNGYHCFCIDHINNHVHFK